MSVPRIHRRPASQAREVVIGLAIVALILAGLSATPLLPWHLLDPIRAYFYERPLLNNMAKAVLLVSFMAVQCLFLIWMERKFAGWLQARLGPMHVGWKGVLQTFADAIKLLLKEDIIPALADKPMFRLAPYLVFVPAMLTLMALPFSPNLVGFDFHLGALFVLSISTTGALGILAAGWGANNKYSVLGGMRAVAQLLSYEIPMILIVLCVVTLENTMSLTQIVERQAGLWNIVAHPLLMIPGALVFFSCALAEVYRAPFDLPEAESELVSGFHTEYSGMRFAIFYIAEFANNVFTAGFATILFFGGWHGPVLPPIAWFTIKTLLLIFLMMWVRWTLPRLRIDQMMSFCWKLLVPASLILLCMTALSVVW